MQIKNPIAAIVFRLSAREEHLIRSAHRIDAAPGVHAWARRKARAQAKRRVQRLRSFYLFKKAA